MTSIYYYLFILVPPFLWAIVNHIDKHLVEKYCKDENIGSLMIFSSIIGIPVAIVSYFLSDNVINIPFTVAILMILSGVIYIVALIPHLYALDQDDASQVVPFMLTTPIFSLILSFFFLNERLSSMQLFSIYITILGAFVLSIDVSNIKFFKFKSKTLLLMLVSCFLASVNTILFKFNNIEVAFFTNVFWTHIGFVVMGIILLAIPSYRRSFVSMVSHNKVAIWTINSIGEILTIVGNILAWYVSLFFPIALIQSLTEGIQPLFVLGIGLLGTIFFPKYIKENITKNELIKKGLGILIMMVGFVMINL